MWPQWIAGKKRKRPWGKKTHKSNKNDTGTKIDEGEVEIERKEEN